MQEFIQKLSKKQKIMIISGIIVVFIILFIVAFKYFYSDEKIENTQNMFEENQIKENIIEQFEFTKTKNRIVVHVIGEVNNPGVVELNEGARIIDAINKCGGSTQDSDLSIINLAYILEDGVQIYIPKKNENLEDKELFVSDAGKSLIMESATKENENTSINSTKVNINTANEEKLKALPGVGESMAKKIIDYRNKNGKFNSIEDIKNVSGIGDSKYENIKEYLTIK